MGQRCCKSCPLKKEDLDEYELLTFLTRSEIVAAHCKFTRLSEVHAGGGSSSGGGGRETRLPFDAVISGTPELAGHPFGDRVCAAFSSERDGRMGFDDYLDMFSVASERATPDVKVHFAFLAADFDGDGVVGRADLGRAADRIYRAEDRHLTADERRKIVARIMEEVDVDKDGFVCKPEFKFAVARCPDFFDSFKMYLN